VHVAKRVFFKPPRLRSGEQGEKERHATWLELFYDLVFVAAVAQHATGLGKDYTWLGMSRFFVLFVPVWWAWVGHTFYLSRFDSEDMGQPSDHGFAPGDAVCGC
jgi:low temperature requirement protein LtrA